MSYQGTQIYSCVSAYNLPGRGLPLWKFHIVLDMWLYTACVTFGTGSILYYFKTFFILGFCYARGQMPNTANLSLATKSLKNMAYLKQHWSSPGHFYWSSSSQGIWGGGRRRQRWYAKSKLQKTDSFTEVKPLIVHQSTHIMLAALIFPKCPVDNAFLSFVITRCQNF